MPSGYIIYEAGRRKQIALRIEGGFCEQNFFAKNTRLSKLNVEKYAEELFRKAKHKINGEGEMTQDQTEKGGTR